jgi:hypothetical protein
MAALGAALGTTALARCAPKQLARAAPGDTCAHRRQIALAHPAKVDVSLLIGRAPDCGQLRIKAAQAVHFTYAPAIAIKVTGAQAWYRAPRRRNIRFERSNERQREKPTPRETSARRGHGHQ